MDREIIENSYCCASYQDGKKVFYEVLIGCLEDNKNKIIDDDLIEKVKKELLI